MAALELPACHGYYKWVFLFLFFWCIFHQENCSWEKKVSWKVDQVLKLHLFWIAVQFLKTFCCNTLSPACPLHTCCSVNQCWSSFKVNDHHWQSLGVHHYTNPGSQKNVKITFISNAAWGTHHWRKNWMKKPKVKKSLMFIFQIKMGSLS